MSLKDRVAKSREARKGFKMPECELNVRFKGGCFSKSKKTGEELISLEFKVVSVKTCDAMDKDELLDLIKEKQKQKVEVTYLTRLDFTIDKVCDFLESTGYDLDKIEENAGSKQKKDLERAWEELEELAPKAVIKCTPWEDPKTAKKGTNYYINEVQKVFADDEDEDEED